MLRGTRLARRLGADLGVRAVQGHTSAEPWHYSTETWSQLVPDGMRSQQRRHAAPRTRRKDAGRDGPKARLLGLGQAGIGPGLQSVCSVELENKREIKRRERENKGVKARVKSALYSPKPKLGFTKG